MKLILSRKGFDSSSGGCPNPIFPDGSVLALPIPDSRSKIAYQDIQHDLSDGSSLSIGDLVSDLTSNKIKRTSGAHLDPDMIPSAINRSTQWQPVLGQTGSAQGHLAKQSIGVDDVFLFFGLFRPVERFKNGRKKPKWRFLPGSKPVHLMWGWMQVKEMLSVPSGCLSSHDTQYQWLNYHPHLHGEDDKNNTLYIAKDMLSFGTGLPGHGIFNRACDDVILTVNDCSKPSLWSLPAWFYPYSDTANNKTPLSYHNKVDRWNLEKNQACILQSVARGQEFVLDMEEYPESVDWLTALIDKSLR